MTPVNQNSLIWKKALPAPTDDNDLCDTNAMNSFANIADK